MATHNPIRPTRRALLAGAASLPAVPALASSPGQGDAPCARAAQRWYAADAAQENASRTLDDAAFAAWHTTPEGIELDAAETALIEIEARTLEGLRGKVELLYRNIGCPALPGSPPWHEKQADPDEILFQTLRRSLAIMHS